MEYGKTRPQYKSFPSSFLLNPALGIPEAVSLPGQKQTHSSIAYEEEPTRRRRPSLVFLLVFFMTTYNHKRHKSHDSMRRSPAVSPQSQGVIIPEGRKFMGSMVSHTAVQTQGTIDDAENESKCNRYNRYNRYMIGISGWRSSLPNCSRPSLVFFSLSFHALFSCFAVRYYVNKEAFSSMGSGLPTVGIGGRALFESNELFLTGIDSLGLDCGARLLSFGGVGGQCSKSVPFSPLLSSAS